MTSCFVFIRSVKASLASRLQHVSKLKAAWTQKCEGVGGHSGRCQRSAQAGSRLVNGPERFGVSVFCFFFVCAVGSCRCPGGICFAALQVFSLRVPFEPSPHTCGPSARFLCNCSWRRMERVFLQLRAERRAAVLFQFYIPRTLFSGFWILWFSSACSNAAANV